VYERLCGEGLLEMRHGQGTFVTGRMSQTRMAAHRERLVEELRQIARQATGLGLSTDELHELLAEAVNGVARREAAVAIEEAKT
jgi:GntR family transcriptional regulator